jgi:hypothetical protein
MTDQFFTLFHVINQLVYREGISIKATQKEFDKWELMRREALLFTAQ